MLLFVVALQCNVLVCSSTGELVPTQVYYRVGTKYPLFPFAKLTTNATWAYSPIGFVTPTTAKVKQLPSEIVRIMNGRLW